MDEENGDISRTKVKKREKNICRFFIVLRNVVFKDLSCHSQNCQHAHRSVYCGGEEKMNTHNTQANTKTQTTTHWYRIYNVR